MCKTYWLISATPRPSKKTNKLLHPNGQPIMNYLNAPGHPFGSNSSINLKRTDSLRRPGGKTSSPIPVKKSFHKTVADDESAALLNQTPVWAKGGLPPLLTTWCICRGHAMSSTVNGEVDKSLICCKWTSRVIFGGCSEIYGSARACGVFFFLLPLFCRKSPDLFERGPSWKNRRLTDWR